MTGTRLRGRLLALTLATALTAALAPAGTASAAPGETTRHAGASAAEGTIRHAGAADAVRDSYIVVLRDDVVRPAADATGTAGVTRIADRLRARYGGSVGHVYGSALAGFEVRLSERAARRLAADPAVAYVEQNRVTPLIGPGTQLNPPSWGLDRIDQRNLPLDNRYSYPNTAHNVHVYVVDTGVRATHVDFGPRVTGGVDLVDGALPADDCNGHGTHLAGTIGGTSHGVAKEVRIHPVRVLNCTGSGTYATVIAGIDWISANALRPAVVELAIGGSANSTLDAAVTNSINRGITYVTTGGSSSTNACNFSPGRVPGALTVVGTSATDARLPSGNYGSCIDLYAPGQNITSAWYTSNTAVTTISGGSTASAHVAGCAALALSTNPTWTPAQVSGYLTSRATTNIVTGVVSGTPNRLLYCGP
ncbi:S8 family peptidase [Micromonospora inyonensis]|uniref:Serine protease, subtilisin family n=1 Tax=Micromonospora inyonensis TaxID=47866 RepID=A0A1C6RXX4_9ACTN|nr:S8 family peptidase [Micromonospora inyonensis]SCL21924.1 Serine protease, subtilisin family [Micromonospora inyonensis]